MWPRSAQLAKGTRDADTAPRGCCASHRERRQPVRSVAPDLREANESFFLNWMKASAVRDRPQRVSVLPVALGYLEQLEDIGQVAAIAQPLAASRASAWRDRPRRRWRLAVTECRWLHPGGKAHGVMPVGSFLLEHPRLTAESVIAPTSSPEGGPRHSQAVGYHSLETDARPPDLRNVEASVTARPAARAERGDQRARAFHRGFAGQAVPMPAHRGPKADPTARAARFRNRVAELARS